MQVPISARKPALAGLPLAGFSNFSKASDISQAEKLLRASICSPSVLPMFAKQTEHSRVLRPCRVDIAAVRCDWCRPKCTDNMLYKIVWCVSILHGIIRFCLRLQLTKSSCSRAFLQGLLGGSLELRAHIQALRCYENDHSLGHFLVNCPV